ncbi:response regulator [Phenylobacterium sp. J367]|uniref:response regulator n=1 Tax=Phenylobacterium sp. J367 TaxID=2898435 RepID=UPI0021509A56|nr:response regulator [Phenylobacterium sp. J367]MCR5878541.1 response regulator [Phenylobacterium sp. J367]
MASLKVLYVDDDEFIREVAELALGLDPEMEIRVADSGAAALALVGGGGFAPDVFLLDVMMPQMDGPATLAELRKVPGHAGTPAIFVTARAQAAEHRPLIEAGAAGVLTKPFDPVAFAGEVRAILAR